MTRNLCFFELVVAIALAAAPGLAQAQTAYTQSAGRCCDPCPTCVGQTVVQPQAQGCLTGPCGNSGQPIFGGDPYGNVAIDGSAYWGPRKMFTTGYASYGGYQRGTCCRKLISFYGGSSGFCGVRPACYSTSQAGRWGVSGLVLGYCVADPISTGSVSPNATIPFGGMNCGCAAACCNAPPTCCQPTPASGTLQPVPQTPLTGPSPTPAIPPQPAPAETKP